MYNIGAPVDDDFHRARVPVSLSLCLFNRQNIETWQF